MGYMDSEKSNKDKIERDIDESVNTVTDDPHSSCVASSLKRKHEENKPNPNSEENNPLPRWVAGASPAKFVTLDELMDMSAAMENMALVHEIAINPDFTIPEDATNPIEKAVKDCVHQIYWDKMKEDLAKQPPDYSNAFSTLLDVKKMIMGLLTPQHVRLKMEIDSRLDEDILRQQLDKNCLDWPRVSEYIIDLLARLCAPVRDEMVAELRQKADFLDILRGICELLEVMKIDMANFEVKQTRPIIEEHSAVYERNQFFKILKNDPDVELSVSDWLKEHLNAAEPLASTSDVVEPLIKRRFEDLNNTEVGAIICDAYMDLLEWNDVRTYPSTLLIDRARFEQLAGKYLQLIICTSCVLVTCVSAGRDVIDTSHFKRELKNELMVITEDIDLKNLNDRLEAAYVHCDAKLKKIYEERQSLAWTKEKANGLKLQIMSLANPQNSVRSLMRQRIRAFILSILKCEGQSSQQKLPAGVSMVREELNGVTVAFVRLASHNRKAFGVYYGDLIKKLMSV